MARVHNGPRVIAILASGITRIHERNDHTLTQARALYDHEADEDDVLVVSLLIPDGREFKIARTTSR